MASNREVIVTATGRVVTLAIDDDPPIGHRIWGVLMMQLTDEITGKPPTGQISLQIEEKGLLPRVAAGGIVGLVANPFAVFPDLINQPYPIHMTVRIAGYLPVRLETQVDQALNFPVDFVPKNLGVLGVHTMPTVIRGQVVRVSAAGVVTPEPNATVEVTGFWPTPPTLLSSPPASAANMLAVSPPLYASRPSPGGQLRRRTMTVNAGQDKTLLNFAAAGSSVLDLSDRVGAQVGRFLAVEPGTPERMEIMEITVLDGGVTPQEPAMATLSHPLAYNHERGTLVHRVSLQAPGFTKNFDRPAHAGDTTVYLNNLTSVVPTVVQIIGGGPPPEYHTFQFYSTQSGPQGYYRLPPIHRAGVLVLRARKPPLPDVNLNFAPDYSQPENQVDFVFRP